MSYHRYVFQPRPYQEMVNDPAVKVVVDTNVLLAAYQWRDVTLDEILDSLRRLSSTNRLVIPSHVMKEFSRLRPGLIADMISRIEQQISQKFQVPNEISEIVPALGRTSFVSSAKRARQRYIRAGQDYRTELNKLKDHLSLLFVKDKVMDEYAQIFSTAWYEPDDMPSAAELEAESTRRFKDNIPPGYKDAKKEANASGDFIIWKHILSLHCDTIFVSFDNKPDWVVTAKDMPISTRRELVEEFYDECGKSFHIVSPRDFFPLLRPNMSEEIKQDLTIPTVQTSYRRSQTTEIYKERLLAELLKKHAIGDDTLSKSIPSFSFEPYSEASLEAVHVDHCIICGGLGPLVKGLCEKCNDEIR